MSPAKAKHGFAVVSFFFCAFSARAVDVGALVDVGPITRTNWQAHTAERQRLDKQCQAGDGDACVSYAELLLSWWDRVNAGQPPPGEVAKARDAAPKGRALVEKWCGKKQARACGVVWRIKERDIDGDAAMLKLLPTATIACKGGDRFTCAAVVQRLKEWTGWVRPRSDPNRTPAMLQGARDFFAASCSVDATLGCTELGDMKASRFWSLPIDRKAARTHWQRACDAKEARACARLQLEEAAAAAVDDAGRLKACALGHGESCVILGMQQEQTTPSSPAAEKSYRAACAAGVFYGCLAAQRIWQVKDLPFDETLPLTGGGGLQWPAVDVLSFVDPDFLAKLCTEKKLAAACAAPCHRLGMMTLESPAPEQEKLCLPLCAQGLSPCRGDSRAWLEAGCNSAPSACMGLAEDRDIHGDHDAVVAAARKACALAPDGCTDRISQLLLRARPVPHMLQLVEMLEKRCFDDDDEHACTQASLPLITGAQIPVDKARAKKLLQEGCKLGECQKTLLESL